MMHNSTELVNNLPFYLPDNHHSLEAVCWMGGVSYMEARHLILVHFLSSLIYLVDRRCVLLAPSVLLCHQFNCLQSAVEPSRSPLPNSGTACLTTSF